MPLDPARATFVQNSHRHETVENPSIKTTYPTAREFTLDTNLTTAAASALATNIFNANSATAQAYRIEVEGIYRLEDLEGSPPRFVLDLPQYVTDGRTFKVTAIEVDFLRNRSVLEVRG